MRQVQPGLYMFERLRSSNAYLLASENGLTLVDTGLRGQSGRIVDQLHDAGYELSDLTAIVLTHAHGDHAGNAAELAARSGAPVFAHAEEVPYIEKSCPMPAASRLQRFLDWFSDRFFFRREPCRVDRALQDGDVLEAWGGLQVIHTPGHTPGSISLYQPDRRVLICGDMLFSEHPLTGKKGLRTPPGILVIDETQLRASLRRLAALPADVACFGHGDPILEGAAARIRAMVRRSLPRRSTILLRETSAEALEATLAEFGAVREDYGTLHDADYWLYPSAQAPLLELHLVRDLDAYEVDLTADAFESWWLPLKTVMAAEPALALRVYVADGDAAAQTIRRCVAAILEAHEGLAQDDKSPRAWTLDEIRAGLARDGVPFFQT